jgi:hypothetical protein
MRFQTAIFIALAGCATAAQAEMVQAPQLLVYGPNLLGQYVGSQGQLPFQGALPPGSGGAIVAFAHLLGLLAVRKSLAMMHKISNTNGGGGQGQESWGPTIGMFIAGICVFHIDNSMATLAATIPGFPDMTPILNY